MNERTRDKLKGMIQGATKLSSISDGNQPKDLTHEIGNLALARTLPN